MKILLILNLLILTIVLMSCSNSTDESCFSYSKAYVTNVDGPAIGNINEEIVLNVDFQVHNGCGNFNRFIDNKVGNTREIEVEAKYNNCLTCTQNLPIRTTNYTFQSSISGTFYLKFKSGTDEFIIDTLAIN